MPASEVHAVGHHGIDTTCVGEICAGQLDVYLVHYGGRGGRKRDCRGCLPASCWGHEQRVDSESTATTSPTNRPFGKVSDVLLRCHGDVIWRRRRRRRLGNEEDGTRIAHACLTSAVLDPQILPVATGTLMIHLVCK